MKPRAPGRTLTRYRAAPRAVWQDSGLVHDWLAGFRTSVRFLPSIRGSGRALTRYPAIPILLQGSWPSRLVTCETTHLEAASMRKPHAQRSAILFSLLDHRGYDGTCPASNSGRGKESPAMQAGCRRSKGEPVMQAGHERSRQDGGTQTGCRRSTRGAPAMQARERSAEGASAMQAGTDGVRGNADGA